MWRATSARTTTKSCPCSWRACRAFIFGKALRQHRRRLSPPYPYRFLLVRPGKPWYPANWPRTPDPARVSGVSFGESARRGFVMGDLEQLIQTVGYLGLFAIVFAESCLFFGFFLPGDSLLLTAP